MTEKDLRKTYYPNYFSIDNILASQTLIPCRTQMRLPKFGFLAPNCQSEDLPVGVNLDLPLWAARVLCKPGRTYVSVQLPAGFKEAHRDVTEDKVTKTDLSKIHSQYFEAGHLCTSLFHNDAGELAEMLPEVLQQRVLCIGETTIPYPRPVWARKVYSNEPIPPGLMDILELKIFQDADKGSKHVLQWLETIRNVPRAPAAITIPVPKHHRLMQSENQQQQQHQQQRSPQMQQHHSPVAIPAMNSPSHHQAIITSSHQNPYSNMGGHPTFMPQYVPMNMSVNNTVPHTNSTTSHSMSNHINTNNFHQNMPYQQQQQQHQNHHHVQQHHHHHNNY